MVFGGDNELLVLLLFSNESGESTLEVGLNGGNGLEVEVRFKVLAELQLALLSIRFLNP